MVPLSPYRGYPTGGWVGFFSEVHVVTQCHERPSTPGPTPISTSSSALLLIKKMQTSTPSIED